MFLILRIKEIHLIPKIQVLLKWLSLRSWCVAEIQHKTDQDIVIVQRKEGLRGTLNLNF